MDLVSLTQSIYYYCLQKSSGSKSRHRRKHSVEIDGYKLEDAFDSNSTGNDGDSKISDAAGTPSTSVQVQEATHDQQIAREEWAAIRIQTAFRGFLVLALSPFAAFIVC